MIINNLIFVSLTLYPFFGMMVYYHTFSVKVFLMAIFIFLILLIIDLTKDLLTKNADKIFSYQTITNVFGNRISKAIIVILLILLYLVSMILVNKSGIHNILNLYFVSGLLVIILCIYLLLNSIKKSNFIVLNILRIWVFIGIIAMLFDGIIKRF